MKLGHLHLFQINEILYRCINFQMQIRLVPPGPLKARYAPSGSRHPFNDGTLPTCTLRTLTQRMHESRNDTSRRNVGSNNSYRPQQMHKKLLIPVMLAYAISTLESSTETSKCYFALMTLPYIVSSSVTSAIEPVIRICYFDWKHQQHVRLNFGDYYYRGHSHKPYSRKTSLFIKNSNSTPWLGHAIRSHNTVLDLALAVLACCRAPGRFLATNKDLIWWSARFIYNCDCKSDSLPDLMLILSVSVLTSWPTKSSVVFRGTGEAHFVAIMICCPLMWALYLLSWWLFQSRGAADSLLDRWSLVFVAIMIWCSNVLRLHQSL